MATVLWLIYLAAMLFLTYDLISSSISRIVRGKLDTDMIHLTVVSIMWAVWYFYYLH